MPGRTIEIEYVRPPGRLTVFRQQLVHRSPTCVVTYVQHAELQEAVRARGTPVLHPGAPVVWFTFPGLWHDIGRFHSASGHFTGYYANVLTPVEFLMPTRWRTTDLFLDVWLDDAGVIVLDEDELDAAEASGTVSAELASRARVEARELVGRADAGVWPPAICGEYTLARARHALQAPDGTSSGPAV